MSRTRHALLNGTNTRPLNGTNTWLRLAPGMVCAAMFVWCAPGQVSAAEAARPAPPVVSDAGPWGKDPFGSPPEPVSVERHQDAAEDKTRSTATAGTSPDLEGIIAGPSGVVAILNGRIVRVGDRVNGERVREITPNAVTLQRGQQVRRIGLRSFTLP